MTYQCKMDIGQYATINARHVMLRSVKGQSQLIFHLNQYDGDQGLRSLLDMINAEIIREIRSS